MGQDDENARGPACGYGTRDGGRRMKSNRIFLRAIPFDFRRCASRRPATIHRVLVLIGLLVFALSGAGAAPPEPKSAPGPRGAVGPEAALDDAEVAVMGKRVTVQGQTGAAVQQACVAAHKQGVMTVYLPEGEYALDATVRVPAGLTLLGAGAKTRVRTQSRKLTMFLVEQEGVRFTHLKIEGPDTTTNDDNNTCGIRGNGARNLRIDHCELLGLCQAINLDQEATAQVDHCRIHHNLRDGLGYGVSIYAGAWVLASDNQFAQNRHSLASNGALDWGSAKRLGKYVHKPEVRKTHWEFVHNQVGNNNLSHYELCMVDTHPGMDGTFVVEGNVFEELRYGIGIRDGSGIIRDNLFRKFDGRADRPRVAIGVMWGKHNGIEVDGTMPQNIVIAGNRFEEIEGKVVRYDIGKARNVSIDGKIVESTREAGDGTATTPAAILRLQPMGADGVLRRSER